MRILITPSDIVKRGLWDTYAYYVVGSEKEAEKLLIPIVGVADRVIVKNLHSIRTL